MLLQSAQALCCDAGSGGCDIKEKFRPIPVIRISQPFVRKTLMLILLFWPIPNPSLRYLDHSAIELYIIFFDHLFPVPLHAVVCPQNLLSLSKSLHFCVG